jgi:4-amino-4-deoxy-L-arabinose transferase-like glycosyltransferase
MLTVGEVPAVGWARLRAAAPRQEVVIGAVVLLALLARVVVMLVSPHYKLTFDAVDYDRHARSIATGHGYPPSLLDPNGGPTAFRPPLYPYLLGAIYWVVGVNHGVTAGRAAGAVLGTVSVVLIWMIARRLWGERPAIAAAAVAAIWPPLLFLNASLMSEELFIAIELGVALTALIARSRDGDWRWAVICGVLCGLATLTRSNGVILVIPAAVGIWVAKPRWSARALSGPVALVLAMVLTIAPWTIRNASAFHQFVPVSTQTGLGLAGFLNDEAKDLSGYPGVWQPPQDIPRYATIFTRRPQNEAQLDRALRARAMRYALNHPGYLVEGAALNILRTLSLAPNPSAAIKLDDVMLGLSSGAGDVLKWSFLLALPLTLAGAVLARRRPRGSRGPAFIWAMPLILLPALAWVVALPRYRAPTYPFMALLLGLGAAELMTWIGRRRAESRAR